MTAGELDRSASHPTGPARCVVVHYHVFKNAGTSLDRTLRENFPDGWVGREADDGALQPDAIAEYVSQNEWVTILSSHTALLPEPKLDGVHIIPVMFVRHPLDRIRSVYDFERVQDAETDGARAAKRLDIGGYIEWRLERAEITGDRSLRDFQAHRLAKGSDGGSQLERALRTIERLPFIGLVEEYERSLERLGGVLSACFPGIRLRFYRDNVTTSETLSLDARLAALQDRIGASAYDRLEAANHDDLIVWETVCRMYGAEAPVGGVERRAGLGDGLRAHLGRALAEAAQARAESALARREVERARGEADAARAEADAARAEALAARTEAQAARTAADTAWSDAQAAWSEAQAARADADAARADARAARVEADVARARLRAVGSLRRRLTRPLRRTVERLSLWNRFAANPLFDPVWYLASYPDVRAARIDPYRHYRMVGVVEGRDPNPLFDTDWYLELNPDVRASGDDPLDHYLRHGAREGRDPSPHFDSDWYLQSNPDVASARVNPLLHYLRHGAREGRRPRPDSAARGVVSPGIESAHLRLRRLASWMRRRRNARRQMAVPGPPPSPAAMDAAAMERLATAIARHVPADADVAVVTDGPMGLPLIPSAAVRPFPSTVDGGAHRPAGNTSAIAHLEWLRADGTRYLVVPQEATGWLDSLSRFKWHLETHYAPWAGDPTPIYDLRVPPVGACPVPVQLRRIIDEFRDRFDREPTILDWRSGINLARAAQGCEVFSTQAAIEERLPYMDASVDLVAVPSAALAALAEAERVASIGVLTVAAGNGVGGDDRAAGVSVDWRDDGSHKGPPSASIVIPTYRGLPLVERCLKSFDETVPAYFDVEVIVVDDGSTDGSTDALAKVVERYPWASLLINESNLGFIGAVRRGAEAATRDYLILLNNDTVLLPGWLSPLLRTFRDRPDAGVVGGKLIYPDGRLQEAGGIIFSDGSAANYGHGDSDPDAPRYSYLREVDYVSGALLATSRQVFHDVGGLDPVYGFGYCEDSDYSFKLRSAGLRTYFQPESAIVHVEGGTAGTDLSAGAKKNQVKNQVILAARWRHELQRQPDPPSAMDFDSLHALADRGAA